MEEYLGIYIGLKLLCRDEFMSKYASSSIYRWRKAEVLAIEGSNHSRILVHFEGWSKSFDFWIDLLVDINRIAPIDMIDEENAYKGISLTEEQLERSIYFFKTGIILNSVDIIKTNSLSINSIKTNVNSNTNTKSDINCVSISQVSNKDIATELSSDISNTSYNKVSKEISMNTANLMILDKSSKEYTYILHKRLHLFHIGLQIEVMDIFYKKGSISPTYKWRLSEVIDIIHEDGIIIIHYINWSNRYDEELHVIFDADRLRAITKISSISVQDGNTLLQESTISNKIKRMISEKLSTIKSSLVGLDDKSITNAVKTSIHSVATPFISEEVIKTFTIHSNIHDRYNDDDNDVDRTFHTSSGIIESGHEMSPKNDNDIIIKQDKEPIHQIYTTYPLLIITSKHDILHNSMDNNKLHSDNDINIKSTTEINDVDESKLFNATADKSSLKKEDILKASNQSYKEKNHTMSKFNTKTYLMKTLKKTIRKIVSWIIMEPKQSFPNEDKLDPNLEVVISTDDVTSIVSEDNINTKEASTKMLSRDQQFISALETKGLHVFKIQGDGSCLFRAVSHQLYMDQNMHEELRDKVVKHLIEHRDRFELFCDEDYDDHINAMRKVTTWGDDLEIRALEELTDRLIRIYRSDQENFDEPMHDINIEEQVLLKDVTPIILSYHGSNHYNSVHDEGYPTLPLPLRASKILLRSRMLLHGSKRDINLRIIEANSNNINK